MFALLAMGRTVGSEGAQAAGASGAAGGSSMLIMILAMVAIFYFLAIRPQKKREKETKNMLAAMKKGDKVQSIGGIRGTVVAVKENTVLVKIDDNAKIEFAKNAISQIITASAPAEEKKEKKEEIVEAPVVEEVATAEEVADAVTEVEQTDKTEDNQ